MELLAKFESNGCILAYEISFFKTNNGYFSEYNFINRKEIYRESNVKSSIKCLEGMKSYKKII